MKKCVKVLKQIYPFTRLHNVICINVVDRATVQLVEILLKKNVRKYNKEKIQHKDRKFNFKYFRKIKTNDTKNSQNLIYKNLFECN